LGVTDEATLRLVESRAILDPEAMKGTAFWKICHF